ncbi:MAG: triose-phosphate isomerase [Burkholderiaceae bacterium]|nr:triose-phosphate isomerase [Burkholderiaceae bacterium]
MRRPLVVGNWKMNGSLTSNSHLLKAMQSCPAIEGCEIVICPPSIFLTQCLAEVSNTRFAIGAQDVSEHKVGAFTGEVSAAMLAELGCKYVIVGHSERRQFHCESNGLVARKAARALDVGLIPIICVGETLTQRESGLTFHVLAEQLDAVLNVIDTDVSSAFVVSYEPVWAIGTGKTATPEMAQDVHSMLREKLNIKRPNLGVDTRILYGGSIKPENAAALFSMPDIDGGLVGGASLDGSMFMSIAKSASDFGS